MNILFLTMVKVDSLYERGLYTDLLRKFLEEGHNITVVTPTERREKKMTQLFEFENHRILKVKTFNLQKTNIVEKGLGTLAIERQFLGAVKKYLGNIKFDLVMYSTPPITFSNVVEYLKKRDNAFTYLLLKDIFPQNAVDMKMLKKDGILHRLFTKKEKKLYKISDKIGCMSQANVDFLLKHNKEISTEKIHVNPNTIEPIKLEYSELEKKEIRRKYDIPTDKTVFIYGGNLGKPQGVDFLLETILQNNQHNAYFLVVGSGTEYSKVYNWFKEINPKNAKLLQGLPKNDYDKLLSSCDVGLIFLHKDFTIPNFPSRLLSYLEMKMPVIAATDKNTDIGDVIEKAICGYKVISGDISGINEKILKFCLNKDLIDEMGNNGWDLLINNYTVDHSYEIIIKNIKA
ncbi:glycosyltransferase WbuB [Chryseobacterium joostei]|uniref:Glycosyltransferase WbuB n=1 Tax=Chryseobacterium joostei TaxID=112234 RepID=A0A1N7I3V7_9FLAO|nr:MULTISPECIES: glycosyltransferase family 4 protein [Chryseobacterium]AZA99831.1 glycosyltransferase WbuB [Chryseobacterium joostei]SIS31716.1 Glycosyltransferase involved in cell wall bisynthesis [Chryseobacterium joostei]HCM33532.1 glycosyltransferase WbuB [Chryseobacterium sp.]